MYSISIFILHFSYLGVHTHPTHPPTYGTAKLQASFMHSVRLVTTLLKVV